MSAKRPFASLSITNAKRRKSGENLSYFQRVLQDCGLVLNKPPKKCQANKDTVYIVRDLNKSLKQHEDYPHNLETFFSEFKTTCDDKETFKHYLFLNVVRKTDDRTYNVDTSVMKILLNVPFLQNKLVSYIFDIMMDILDQPDFGPWVKMALKSFSNLDTVESSEELSTKLIDLLDVSLDKFVRLEIISAIPDIIGDREHDNVAKELGRILSNERYLIPSILDCLSYLCLSDLQFKRLQKETLLLMQPSNAAYFANFVKFLLTPGRLDNSEYEETIKGLRKELGWPSIIGSEEEIATSQILTVKEIRNSMLSSKSIEKAWMKVISSCTPHNEHKPIDIIFFLIIASLSDEKQKQVEKLMRNQIKLQILKKELLDKAFEVFKPILKKNITTLISLANSLLKPRAEPSVEAFGAHMHMVMFSKLTECRQLIVYELLQLVLNCKKSALNTLNILNKIACDNLPVMKPQSTQMLILLDKLDDMTLPEKKAVMDLLCRLAYSFEDSDIRDELHIIIRKELGSSITSIKTQGILAGIHAVKYLMKCTATKVTIPDDVTLNMTECLPEGDLQEAGQIIELIQDSTELFPDRIVYFYDELYKVIHHAKFINVNFLEWLTYAFTNLWQNNFLVNKIEKNVIGDIKVSMQLRLNLESEVDEEWAINIAGLTMEDSKEISIEVMSSLFQLVRILHYKKADGNLGEIDALLGCPIVMPDVDIDSISDLNESLTKNILECYVTCANWIRELINAFVSQEDEFLKPKVLNRIAQLRDLEQTIYKITDKGRNPEHDNTTIAGSSKTQQTQIKQVTKNNKLANNRNIQFRPLDLTLIHVIQYDLTPSSGNETEMSFEILTYLLSTINVSLEKVLVPRIKKSTFLNKDATETYNYSEAEKQARVVSKILPKLMIHIDLILAFLDCHLVEEGNIDLDTLNALNIVESLYCLEQIYHLLTVYFGWIEFKRKDIPLLKKSLQSVATVEDDTLSLEHLLVTVAEIFQKHEKVIITISLATSLMQLMKSFQELSTGPEVAAILKIMALKFLSKQWKTINNKLEKGVFYNQCLDTLTKIFLGCHSIEDLKTIVTTVVDEVANLRDRTSVLTTLKSIDKSNFYILFTNLGAALHCKIKFSQNAGLTKGQLVELWRNVASILKLMSDIVTTLDNKNTSSHFLKKSKQIFIQLLSKGFPILNTEFKDNRQTILDTLKDLITASDCLRNICTQANDIVSIKKISYTEELLTSFICKTEDLLKKNGCSEALKTFNVSAPSNSTSKSKKSVHADVTMEDLDDHLPDDDSDASSYGIDSNNYVGISEVT